jgi:DNA-binding transcriptional ArsR family regulator
MVAQVAREDFAMTHKAALRRVGWGKELGPTAVRLLLGLQGESDLNGRVMMKVNTMAERLGVSRVVASRALRELVEAGFVERGEFQGQYELTSAWQRRRRPESVPVDSVG